MSELTPDDSSPAEAAHPPLAVVREEPDWVAVHKPSGLLVHRDEHHPEAPAALQVVRDQFGRFVYPFHRLDRATSGILLFAFSSAAAAALQAAMSAPTAIKEYIALVRWPGSPNGDGAVLGDAWTCDRPLTDDKGIARAARTDFEHIETLPYSALVRCRIHSGRYHQIRRHANHSGRHVLGDTSHGKGRINALFRERFGLQRLFLHLYRVRFEMEDCGLVEMVDPLPPDLREVLARLRAQPPSPGPAAPPPAESP
jgi:tRNA pseudouridine65 synthase